MKQVRIGFAVACLVPTLWAQPSGPQQSLQTAIELQQAGDFASAAAKYEEFLKSEPRSAPALSNLGVVYARLGRYDEAIKVYRRALAEMPANHPVRLNLSLAYYKAGDMNEAAAELAEIHKSDPANMQATLLLADCWLAAGENGKVIALLAPLDDPAKADLGVAYMLGTALVRDKQPERGQVLIERILRNGDSAEARLLMGTTKLAANDARGALEDLEHAVRLNPALPDVYSYYGQALLTTGDSAGAVAAFRKEIESNPNDFNSNLQLGAQLKQDGNYDEALRYLAHALQVRSANVSVRFEIASIHLAQGKVDAAREELESVVATAPNFTEAHVSLATAYYRSKRKADGDRERALVQKLIAETQSKEPGAQSK